MKGGSARELAAVEFPDLDIFGLEGGLEDRDRRVGIGVAAHEDVEGRVADFGPCVAGNVGFREDRHGGNALRREAVGMQVQERGAGGFCGVAQGLFDERLIIEMVGVVQVDDEVGAGVNLSPFAGQMFGGRRGDVISHGGKMGGERRAAQGGKGRIGASGG